MSSAKQPRPSSESAIIRLPHLRSCGFLVGVWEHQVPDISCQRMNRFQKLPQSSNRGQLASAIELWLTKPGVYTCGPLVNERYGDLTRALLSENKSPSNAFRATS